ncbi:hypothetical protein ACFVAJ_11690 [Agromyces sp. NPDC057679]|uniref:hypothetical protein n=1 Tax=Agromyces sp. NPDC057679 TaxID=3346207 RepID=UPI00366C7C39
MRARGFRLLLGGAVVLAALTGCTSPTTEGTEMKIDATAIERELESIDGVASATIGTASAGTPGSYRLSAKIELDEQGDAALGEVLIGAVRAVDAGADGFTTYAFHVAAPDPAGGDAPAELRLSERRSEIPIEVGAYRGSGLVFTDEELAEAAG